MPARTPDQGVRRFEVRTGINGIPVLGGIYRAGDPATIPQHKLHLGVNIRITPGGTVTRPGLTQIYDTSVEDCITGITGEGEEIATLMIYPGAGAMTVLEPVDPGFGGGTVEVPLNAATFRCIFPGNGDATYSEYANVLAGLPGAIGTLSPVYTCVPFVMNGRIHTLSDLTLIALDLPTRTKSIASNCQLWCGYDPTTFPLVASAGCPGEYPVDQTTLFPGGYPVGTVSRVTTLDDPFTSLGETFDAVYDYLVFSTRSDSTVADGSRVGVREMLYVLCVSNTGRLALVLWDGVTQRTIMTKTGISLYPLRPIVGGTKYGAYVLGSTDGVHGDWGGYVTASGGWAEFAAGIQFDYGETPPGVVPLEVKAWAPVKQSVTGNPEVMVQAYMKIEDAPDHWIDGHGFWVFDAPDSATGWGAISKVVATLVAPNYDIWGNPWDYPVIEGQILPFVRIGTRFYTMTAYALDISGNEIISALYSAAALYTTPTSHEAIALGDKDQNFFGNWNKWLADVGGILVYGGSFNATDEPMNTVHRVYFGTRGLVYQDDCRPAADGVTLTYRSYGCLPYVPGTEAGEGYGTEGGGGTGFGT